MCLIMHRFQYVSSFMRGLFGIKADTKGTEQMTKSTQKQTEAVSGLGDAVDKTAKKKKKAEETNIASDVIPVKVIEINQESIGQTVHASGVFTTEDETYLGFKIGGVIQHILVKEGDAIKSGQLLATLNLTEIKAQVQQAQIGLEKA